MLMDRTNYSLNMFSNMVIFLVFSTSTGANCSQCLVNAGISRVSPNKATESATLKPLSTRITSPGCRFLRYPEFSKMYLSDAQPP